MSGLRHNPYVGSFHGKNFQASDSSASGQLIIEDSKCNPLVGVFRHSPSLPSKSLGLKSILYGGMTKPPVFSQLQVSREAKKFPAHNFLRSLRQIPTKVYSVSSVGSRSERSSASPNQPEEDDHLPTCSICLDPYADGDELRTFACSHCFHNECVSKWIFHRCLDNEELDSFNCPECRQNHITLSEAGSSRTSLAEGISSLSFLQVGENMAREGGYDFLSDYGSDLQSPRPHSMPSSPRPLRRSSSASASSGGIASGEGEGSPRRRCVEEDTDSDLVVVGAHLGSPIVPTTEGIALRTRVTVPVVPVGRMGSTFGARLSVLNNSSNRLLGLFPVPEEGAGSYCAGDSIFSCGGSDGSSVSGVSGSSSPAGSSSATDSLVFSLVRAPLPLGLDHSTTTTQGTLGAASPRRLAHTATSISSPRNTSTSTSATATAGASSSPGRPPRLVQSQSQSLAMSMTASGWALQDPLCASEYSDCGMPLSRM